MWQCMSFITVPVPSLQPSSNWSKFSSQLQRNWCPSGHEGIKPQFRREAYWLSCYDYFRSWLLPSDSGFMPSCQSGHGRIWGHWLVRYQVIFLEHNIKHWSLFLQKPWVWTLGPEKLFTFQWLQHKDSLCWLSGIGCEGFWKSNSKVRGFGC